MPNRIIKESIRTSKKVSNLSDFQFRFWIYLITYVDDYGRGSADPEILRGFVFPRRKGITEEQISQALQALANSGMINLYEVDGESYFCFPNWETHQQVRAKKSKFPAPDTNGYHMISDDIKCPRNPIQSNTESESNPNTNPTRTRAREDEQDNGFTAFWNAYPRKSGDIRQAFMAYLHAQDLGVTPEMLIEAIKAQTDGVSPEDLHFLPSAEKWLRNRGWESKASLKSTKKEDKPKQYTTAEQYKAPVKAKSVDEILELVDKI